VVRSLLAGSSPGHLDEVGSDFGNLTGPEHAIRSGRIALLACRAFGPGSACWLAALGAREVSGQVGGPPGQESTRDPETDGGSDNCCCADDSR
jgi:hypothetical protein